MTGIVDRAEERKTLLEVEHLNVSFRTMNGVVHAVRDVSFHLDQGETLAVVGESGCGKTVMIKSLLRLHDKTNAQIAPGSRILFEGRDIGEMNKKELMELRGNEIAMIFQDSQTSLNPTTQVGKQVEEALLIHKKLPKEACRKRVLELLKMVEMPDAEARMKAYPHQLSGGMRQRAMIAMALACEPKVLLADEPTTALDVTIQAQLMDLLVDLKKKLNMSIILVTHDLSVVRDFADRIQVVYAGQIVERGTTKEIMESPKHPYTMALLQAMPDSYMQTKSRLQTIGGTPPDLRLPLECCSFAARCRYCMNICKRKKPELTDISQTQSARCFLLDERAPRMKELEAMAGKTKDSANDRKKDNAHGKIKDNANEKIKDNTIEKIKENAKNNAKENAGESAGQKAPGTENPQKNDIDWEKR